MGRVPGPDGPGPGPVRIVHARLHRDSIGSALHVAFEEPGPDDSVLVRVRAALDGRSGLPKIEYALTAGPQHPDTPGTPSTVLPGLGEDAQLMVLGSRGRGRGGFAGLLLGSNGLACANRAACPVVVVPRPAHARRPVRASRTRPGQRRPPTTAQPASPSARRPGAGPRSRSW